MKLSTEWSRKLYSIHSNIFIKLINQCLPAKFVSSSLDLRKTFGEERLFCREVKFLSPLP